MTPRTLLAQIARFGRLLRARGIPVGVGDEVDAARALTLVDLLDCNEVRLALRAALRVQRRQWDEFDRAFDDAWTGTERAEVGDAPRPERRTIGDAPLPQPTRSVGPDTKLGAGSSRRHDFAASVGSEPRLGTGQDGDDGARDHPGYSPEAVLRRKPFEECSEADIEQMKRLIDRLAPRLATRRTRRMVPAVSRGRVDVRRTPRRALATGGELLWLARRARAIEEPRLVVLCDTSGSMDIHARFLLTFAFAVRRSIHRTEVFAFNTALTRLTPWFARRDAAATLARLANAVPDWSGGTRIGECLAAFADAWLPQLVNRHTVVAIFSDGLDRGDTSLIAGAMRAIRARARRVVWLNPLGGDPRYEPTARAMQIAMPFVDRLAPAHNLESLERILSQLAV